MNFTISWGHFGLFIQNFDHWIVFVTKTVNLRDICVIFEILMELGKIVKKLEGGFWNYPLTILTNTSSIQKKKKTLLNLCKNRNKSIFYGKLKSLVYGKKMHTKITKMSKCLYPLDSTSKNPLVHESCEMVYDDTSNWSK